MSNQPFIFGAAIFVAIVFVASINTFYQRETTSIEMKYTGSSSAEIDALYHTSYLQVPGDDFALTINENDGSYSDNIKIFSTGMGPNNNLHAGPSNDWDNDGLLNNNNDELDDEGRVTGTQPDNPDTDGDGIIDSQDPAPLDPTIGGAITPPIYLGDNGDGGQQQEGELNIINFYKAACNPNLTGGICDKDNNNNWQINQIDATINQILQFKIHVELQNNSSFTKNVHLLDNLPIELLYYYYPGSAEIQINSNPIHELTKHEDDWLEDPYETLQLTVGPLRTKAYTIWFNAKVLDLPATNTVMLWLNQFLEDASILIE
ncbi:hypothetical protein KKE14_00550 [Patescibacteria group bacterium]|nr:hypothetical protein [Patescibacteria group bacterium]